MFVQDMPRTAQIEVHEGRAPEASSFEYSGKCESEKYSLHHEGDKLIVTLVAEDGKGIYDKDVSSSPISQDFMAGKYIGQFGVKCLGNHVVRYYFYGIRVDGPDRFTPVKSAFTVSASGDLFNYTGLAEDTNGSLDHILKR